MNYSTQIFVLYMHAHKVAHKVNTACIKIELFYFEIFN